jgi:hypothetical protein
MSAPELAGVRFMWNAKKRYRLGLGIFVVFVACTSWAPNSRAQCLSDEELLDVLRSAFLYSMGQTLGICARRYPSLKSNVFQTAESIKATYSYQMRELNRRTEAAFEKNYPGQGKQARDENDRQASLTAALQVEAFSKVQCEKSLHGVQILVRVNDWERFMAYPGVFFREERARIPRCN